MSKHRTDLTKGLPLPSTWVNGLMEFVGSQAANFQITKPSGTTLSVPASADNGQVAIAINGRWRYNTAAVTATHPGGVAGTYDVFVTAADNDWSAADPADSTNYAFGLVILAQGSTPGTALYRRVATCAWDGAAITSIAPLVPVIGVPQHAATHSQGGSDPIAIATYHLADLYGSRPPASTALNGVRFFATDKMMEWQCVAAAWVLVNVLAPEVTALPASPIDWQECIYVADAANGVKWHLRYRVASGSTYKWEYIGGANLAAGNTSAGTRTGGTGYGALSGTTGPSIVAPLAGDYEIEFGAKIVNNTAGASSEVGVQVGATAATVNTSATAGEDANSPISVWRALRATVNAAATTISTSFSSSSGTASFAQMELRLRPVRVG